MKKLKTILSVFAFMAIACRIYSQNSANHHKSLTGKHVTINEHVDSISSGKSKTKEESLKHIEEAIKNIEEAKKEEEKLKNSMPKDHTEVSVPYLAAIKTYHVQATSYANSLSEELRKTYFNEATVKETAKKLHETIEKAEKENIALKEKTKK